MRTDVAFRVGCDELWVSRGPIVSVKVNPLTAAANVIDILSIININLSGFLPFGKDFFYEFLGPSGQLYGLPGDMPCR